MGHRGEHGRDIRKGPNPPHRRGRRGREMTDDKREGTSNKRHAGEEGVLREGNNQPRLEGREGRVSAVTSRKGGSIIMGERAKGFPFRKQEWSGEASRGTRTGKQRTKRKGIQHRLKGLITREK